MWLEYVNIARKELVAHKFRSPLTVPSIPVGAFSIVLMSSLAQSGSTTLLRDLEALGGARLLAIFPKEAEREEGKASSYTRGITRQDRDALFDTVPHLEGHTMFSRLGRKDVIADNGRIGRIDTFAGDGDWFDNMGLAIAKGRFFSDEENL